MTWEVRCRLASENKSERDVLRRGWAVELVTGSDAMKESQCACFTRRYRSSRATLTGTIRIDKNMYSWSYKSYSFLFSWNCACEPYLRLKVRRTPRRMMTNMRIPAMTPAIFTVLSTCFSGSVSLEFWVDAPLKQQVHHKQERGAFN